MDKLYIEENISSNDIIKRIAYDYNLSNYVVLKTKNGKPYFRVGNKDNEIYFNISNKDNITVAVTSSKPVGIDIERLTFNSSVVKHFFSKNEQEIIRESFDKEKDFTTIWVKKEAYIKYLGLDLTSIRKIDTTKLTGFIIKRYKDYLIGIFKE